MSSNLDQIRESASRLLGKIPPEVKVIAAAKTRTLEEVQAVIQAGVKHIGYNYVQEAVPIIQAVNAPVTWHMIGHLQRNKAKLAVEYFDMVETVDSWRLAQALERHCASRGRILPVLVEINSGRETNKAGILPEDVDQ